MRVEKTRDNCLARMDALRKQYQKGEFGNKGFHSTKSIILQISQSDLLSPRNKILLMLEVISKVEEYFQ